MVFALTQGMQCSDWLGLRHLPTPEPGVKSAPHNGHGVRMEVLLSRKGGVYAEGMKQKQMSATKISFPYSKSQSLVRELYI